MTVAVIGAGLAGAACARALVEAGHAVRLFDKGRGPGGRMATRRALTPLGEVRFDHGAQYFTARDPSFRSVVEAWAAEGAAARWTDAEAALGAKEPLWVGAPGMNAVVKAALSGLDVRFGDRVAQVLGEAGDYRLRLESGDEVGAFHAVIVATPAEQAPALLEERAPAFARQAAAARSAPCWAVMAVFEQRLEERPSVIRSDQGAVAWAARDASKPGRADVESWVLHASPAWSRARLEDEPESVAEALMGAFGAPTPAWRTAHRWRFARVETNAIAAFAWDPARRIGVCGDWRLGARVEAAWMSGHALGAAIMRDV